MKKKIISLIAAAIMSVSSVSAFAADGSEYITKVEFLQALYGNTVLTASYSDDTLITAPEAAAEVFRSKNIDISDYSGNLRTKNPTHITMMVASYFGIFNGMALSTVEPLTYAQAEQIIDNSR